jgi:signal transduction histidine kinase
MKRPWQVWLLFAVCVLGALAGMAWLTREAVRADQRRRWAESDAEFEQRVSLALWRIDTKLAPIIAEEVIRPPTDYRPTIDGPVELPPYVLLQFEVRPDGTWVSPQMPAAKSATLPLLGTLSKATSFEELAKELPDTPLPSIADVNRSIAANANAPPNANAGDNQFQFVEANGANAQQEAPSSSDANNMQKPAFQQQAQPPNEVDFRQRGQRYQAAAQQSLINSMSRGLNSPGGGDDITAGKGKQLSSKVPEKVGVSRPLWVDTNLLLARRVSTGPTIVVQGCWLDWPKLRTDLQSEVRDLLPGGTVVVAVKAGGHGNANPNDPKRMLAGLPARLVVCNGPMRANADPTLSWALWIGWGAVALAVMTAAAILHGIMRLSERRAAFVSSVTHELRTPLTTFRMYAEMLAKGMVPDADRRQEYFNTLQREAERLSLLVENVLAYARLERGRRPQAQDRVTVASLLERVTPRLQQRAAQAGMTCEITCDQITAHKELTTDQAVVEQILFNLVDNASKYARDATDRRIHVNSYSGGGQVAICVLDHGPGIKNGAANRAQPFEKSAQESAETAPGVGLGLALCRRLARELGGRLEVAGANGKGAEIKLLLPENV